MTSQQSNSEIFKIEKKIVRKFYHRDIIIGKLILVLFNILFILHVQRGQNVWTLIYNSTVSYSLQPQIFAYFYAQIGRFIYKKRYKNNENPTANKKDQYFRVCALSSFSM